MKALFLCFLTLLVLTACQDDDDQLSPVNGTWRLSAVLSDPGNGSGTFQPVDSDRILELRANGAYTATGDLCRFTTDADASTTGVYNITDGTLFPDDCVTTGGTPLSLFIDGDELTIDYPCIEPCRHRYTRQ